MVQYKRSLCFLILGFILNISCKTTKNSIEINANLQVKANLQYQENFDANLDLWQVEQMEGGTSEIIDKKLEINDKSGCTIWFKEKLNGPTMITYDTYIIKNDGPYDRVSDMNCFWMAQDVKNMDNIFANSEGRGGKFTNYDNLRLYYMGVGGHDNSKTRFRRYVGNGERPLLPEHDFTDEKYLLQPNKKYAIKIIAYKNTIQYYRNGVLMVSLEDAKPYTSGYFGFRTVHNHMTIDNFKVFSLSE